MTETAHSLAGLEQITPVVLTFNERPNIARTLASLDWAADIVVVDSGSTDGTLEILRRCERVRVFERPFRSHPDQWRFAMHETGIATSWVLRLDSDYVLPPAFVAELAGLDLDGLAVGFVAGFDYAVYGAKLAASLYPPKPILIRQGCYAIRDAGHTEAWDVSGAVRTLKSRIVHDDWKPITDWVTAQARYMTRELNGPPPQQPSLARWIRRFPPLMPLAALFYCLVGKGLLLNGRAGLHYALQRSVAEGIYALLYLEAQLKPAAGEQQLHQRHRTEPAAKAAANVES